MNNPGRDSSAGGLSRRGVLVGTGLFVGGAAVTTGSRRLMEPESTDVVGLNPRSDAWYDLRLSGDGLMDNQLLWFLGHATHGQADVSDVMETAKRMRPGDERSWFEAWLQTATRVHGLATTAESKGHRLSAGQAYARAANYYRAATMHYTDTADPRLLEVTRTSAATFEKSNALLDFDIQPLEIPYEGTSLPAYFVRSPHAKPSAPVLLLHQGLHAWPEETKWVWEGARKRGYHVLMFHGPGQGRALREKGLSFRPDWEKAVSPVVDAAERISGVDPRRILLMGLSFGGALAPRAAAFEPRLALCIANPGVLSWWESHAAHFNRFLPGSLALLKSHPEAFDEAILGLASRWPTASYWLKDVFWKHGAKTPSELFRKLEEFTNEAIVERIRCPVLIMEGEAEDVSPGQSRKLYDALRGPKHLMNFTQADAAPLHCQAASTAIAEERMFDWLDENV
ncbi:alpha/beta fold hydrolase [Myxococcus sp. CA056]|uniref:alpha/beta hydrolase family protein n=1 Tax=unclassified Myxococcus TaxID=2648731 RepID=UPI00157B76DE|nr:MULTISPECIES: alpha/beta fold hydrolase [unclassified Myxococcus]NTX17169.1 alpha/beta fold hydrolase [Myxococcus sp. CA056]NTX39297.1 alpha/beta fold hydrolase [Myxococcus sp. CA033]